MYEMLARRNSVCTNCKRNIKVDDPIVITDDGVFCEDCGEELKNGNL